MNRRDCLAALGALLTAPLAGRVFGNEIHDPDTGVGNFRYIYSNPELRSQFLNFLTNVFHLYPEDEFHETLIRLCKPGVSDEQVYTLYSNSSLTFARFSGRCATPFPH
jgi:hypothetical protein